MPTVVQIKFILLRKHHI